MSVQLSSLGEQTQHYAFSATTLAQALQQMARLGPQDGDGHHAASCEIRGDIRQNLQTRIVSGATVQLPENMGWTATAEISQATLHYGFVFRFPQWSNVGGLARAIQTEWQRYTAALWRHERGHVRVSMPVVRTYHGSFQSLRIAATGNSGPTAEQAAERELRSQVQAVYNEMCYRVQEASNRYDGNTRHGRSQGAQLRTRVSASPTRRR